MKTGRLFLIAGIMAVCAFFMTGAVEAADSPKEAIRSTVDNVIDTLKDESLKVPEKKQERRDRIRELIRDRFDFREMSKRSLARHWNKRSPGERDEFVEIFSQLLEDSYIGKIEDYTDEKVTYGKEAIRGKGKYGMVSTTILTDKVDIPIDYKLINKDGKWWVYDVVIEGVSFISTYRSQYNKIIVRESYAELIKKMKEKLKEINEASLKETALKYYDDSCLAFNVPSG